MNTETKSTKNNEKIKALLDEMPTFVEDFHTHLTAGHRSTNTILGYLYEFNVFLRFVATIVKKEKINDIEITDLDHINMTKIEKYISESEDGIKTNPTLTMEGARLKEHDVIKLSESQVKALLKCVKNQSGVSEHAKAYNERLVTRDMAIVMVLLGTGMRISELVGFAY